LFLTFGDQRRLFSVAIPKSAFVIGFRHAMSQQRQVPFSLIGCFLGFIHNQKHQPKALRLATREGEWTIKLAKELRDRDYSAWIPGAQVQVWGDQKLKPQKHQPPKLKLKADRVDLAAYPPVSPLPPIVPSSTAASNAIVKPPRRQTAKAVIQVCHKSDCLKNGGKAVCQAIDRMIANFGLEDVVKVQSTGCMKNCKAAPNLVVLPDKQRYAKIKPSQVPAMIEKHFGHIAASVDLPA
jgi:(2Fe-2S) ferredoxin